MRGAAILLAAGVGIVARYVLRKSAWDSGGPGRGPAPTLFDFLTPAPAAAGLQQTYAAGSAPAPWVQMAVPMPLIAAQFNDQLTQDAMATLSQQLASFLSTNENSATPSLSSSPTSPGTVAAPKIAPVLPQMPGVAAMTTVLPGGTALTSAPAPVARPPMPQPVVIPTQAPAVTASTVAALTGREAKAKADSDFRTPYRTPEEHYSTKHPRASVQPYKVGGA